MVLENIIQRSGYMTQHFRDIPGSTVFQHSAHNLRKAEPDATSFGRQYPIAYSLLWSLAQDGRCKDTLVLGAVPKKLRIVPRKTRELLERVDSNERTYFVHLTRPTHDSTGRPSQAMVLLICGEQDYTTIRDNLRVCGNSDYLGAIDTIRMCGDWGRRDLARTIGSEQATAVASDLANLIPPFMNPPIPNPDGVEVKYLLGIKRDTYGHTVLKLGGFFDDLLAEAERI